MPLIKQKQSLAVVNNSKSLLHAVYQVSKKTNAKACSRHKNSEIVSSDKVIVIHEPLMSSALKNENVQEDMLSQSVHEEIKITEDRSSEGCRDHLTGADKLNLPIIKSYSKVNINNVEYVLVDVTLNATVEIVLNTYSDDNEENAQQRESSLFDNNTNHPGQKTPQSESCLVDLVNDQERSKEGSKLVYHCHVSNCKTVFTNITHYKEHVRKHLEVKPFICSWENCNLSFCRLHELTRHKRLHLGLKPYKCELCEAKFTRSDHLLNHKRSKHKEIFVV